MNLTGTLQDVDSEIHGLLDFGVPHHLVESISKTIGASHGKVTKTLLHLPRQVESQVVLTID